MPLNQRLAITSVGGAPRGAAEPGHIRRQNLERGNPIAEQLPYWV
jgi:hypothetical protein